MSAELAETATTAEVVELLNREDAEKLDRRIRRMAGDTKGKMDTLSGLVADAKGGRIHEVLGYPSWTAYVADALGELCSGAGIETRRELVTYLYGEGMSQRAIAAATGVPKSTVAEDITKVPENRTPDESDVVVEAQVVEEGSEKTTGLDGKTYQRKPNRPQGQQNSRRAPITTTASNLGAELGKIADGVEKILADDRLAKNKDEVAAHLRHHLVRAIEVLQDLNQHIQ